MKVLTPIKLPDLVYERSIRERSLADFLTSYNKSIPLGFPSATQSALLKFKKENPSLFKDSVSWSLDKHRKKFMDWLPQYFRSITLQQEK
jgi:hypothetical protein